MNNQSARLAQQFDLCVEGMVELAGTDELGRQVEGQCGAAA